MSNNQSFGKGLKLYKEKKYTEAVTYFKEAAGQGDAAAQNYLANCYLCGLGIAKNEEEAVKLYRKAVGQSYASAMLNLGYCYEHGLGVKKNEEFASDYYERAANLGNTIAMINLGLMYRDGKGLDKNTVTAEEWFKKAKAKGNNNASSYLSTVPSTSSVVRPTPTQTKVAPQPIKRLPVVVEGNNNFKVIEFGKYPQTVVTDNGIISKLKALKANSEGIITLNGVEYVKVTTKRYYFDSYDKFSNGNKISTSSDYFFKVEPIKWLVLEEGSEIKLVTEKVLNCYRRNTLVYSQSTVRGWLEKEFYNKWLGKDSLIIKQTRDNSYIRGKNPVKDDTQDYVYLLTRSEVLKYFGEGQKNKARLAYTTDYARAVGTYTDDTYNVGAGIWLLSTPTDGWDYTVNGISRTGGIYNYGTYPDHYGIRPGITIKSSNKSVSAPIVKPAPTVNQPVSDIIEFGYFPQTIVSDAKLINILSNIKEDNRGYITYNNETYAKVTRGYSGFQWDEKYRRYSNNEKYVDKKVNFFKVEPLKWIVLKNDNNTLELMTEKIIFSNPRTSGYAYTYENLKSRAWLNKEFIDLALSGLENYLVGKKINSEIPASYGAKVFTDKVYLLSYLDACNSDYGFPDDESRCEERQAYVTDYAIANGCYADNDLDNIGIWLLRLPEFEQTNSGKWMTTRYNSERGVSRTGGVYNYNHNNSHYGLRPVITINKSYLENKPVAKPVAQTEPIKPVEQAPAKPVQQEPVKPVEPVKPIVKEEPVKPQSAPNPTVAPTIKKEPVVVVKTTTQAVEKLNTNEIYYGKYPQSVVTDSNIISKLSELTPNSNGYYFLDGVEYEKVTAKPYREKFKFRNGDPVVTGKDYFFKVEPIKWNILKNNNGELLLLTSVLLDQVKFHQGLEERTVGGVKINARNYEYSEIREWINKHFYNKALSSEHGILLSQIDNSISTCASDYTGEVCNNFADLAFIPSYKEVISEEYGYSEPTHPCDARCLKLTDYNIAKGAHMMTNTEYNYNGSWWLRTPNETGEDFVHYVDYDGMVNHCLTSNKIRSIAVAIRIKK